MMVDNLQLEPLSVQFCGELMSQVHIDMCSIIDISNPYLTVNPPRLPVPVHRDRLQGQPPHFFPRFEKVSVHLSPSILFRLL